VRERQRGERERERRTDTNSYEASPSRLASAVANLSLPLASSPRTRSIARWSRCVESYPALHSSASSLSRRLPMAANWLASAGSSNESRSMPYTSDAMLTVESAVSTNVSSALRVDTGREMRCGWNDAGTAIDAPLPLLAPAPDTASDDEADDGIGGMGGMPAEPEIDPARDGARDSPLPPPPPPRKSPPGVIGCSNAFCTICS